MSGSRVFLELVMYAVLHIGGLLLVFFNADAQVYFAMRYNLNVIGTIAQYVAVLFLFILTSDL